MRYINKSFDYDLNVLRGIAAVLVFTWHFLHHSGLNDEEKLWSILPFFTEGHIGVSLFMVLSGFLFSAILIDQRIDWLIFWKNRACRILPLLLITQLLWFCLYQTGLLPANPFSNLPSRLLYSGLSGGAWSIVTELHFYALLPLVLLCFSRGWGPGLLIVAVVLEILSFNLFSPRYTYHGILGRLGQFIIGGLICKYFERLKYSKSIFLCFWAYLIWFDVVGGDSFYKRSGNLIFTIRFTVEGIGCGALLVALKRLEISPNRIYKAFSYLGDISYSFYLWHFFILGLFFKISKGIPQPLIYLLAVPVFLMTLLLSHYSYKQIELRFLKARGKYILPQPDTEKDHQPM